MVRSDSPFPSVPGGSDETALVDIEQRMRERLGIGVPVDRGQPPGRPILTLSPERVTGAREAIRSAANLRSAAEHRLSRSEAQLTELRQKLRAAAQERDSALAAARSAAADKAASERIISNLERTLEQERQARERTERSLREANQRHRELEIRFETATQANVASRAELVSERDAREKLEGIVRDLRERIERPSVDSAKPGDAEAIPGGLPVAALPAPAGHRTPRHGRSQATPAPASVARPPGRKAVPTKAGLGKETPPSIGLVPAKSSRQVTKPRRFEAQEPVKWWLKT